MLLVGVDPIGCHLKVQDVRGGAENWKHRVQGLLWKQQMLAGSVKLPAGGRAGSEGGE